MNNLTPEQQKFIEEITEKMSKQNNRATAFPLYYVYDKEELSVGQDADADREILRDEDWHEINEITDDDEEIWKFDGKQMWTNQKTGEEITSFELQDNYAREYTVDYMKRFDKPVVNVGPFLTEEGAQAHIDANNYHYEEPYIYVNSCWRNYELQNILTILFTLAGKEVPRWYK